jgi:cytochrome c oxidase subunit 2
VRLTAIRTTWQASYLDHNSGATLRTGREIHVPLNAEIRLELASRDYVSDFNLPDFKLRDFAAPGIPSSISFKATHPGRFRVEGGELCGRPHNEDARGWLIVEPSESFQSWIQSL